MTTHGPTGPEKNEQPAAAAQGQDRVTMPPAEDQPVATNSHPDWLPGESPLVVKVGDGWRMYYGNHNEYFTDFPSEPAWCATNRAVKELLEDSPTVWGLYREIVALKRFDEREVIQTSVRQVVDRINDQSICERLGSVFDLRLRDEQKSAVGWGAAGGLCNMIALYSEVIAACQVRGDFLRGVRPLSSGSL